MHSILNGKQAVISRKDSFAGARNDSESFGLLGQGCSRFQLIDQSLC